MKEIMELSEKLNNLCIGKITKINIHFNINNELLELCEKINQDINNVTNGFIRFGIQSIAVPHISIFMGYINSHEQLKEIFEQTSALSKEIKPFRIDPTRLYFKSITENSPQYLFLDVLQGKEIMQFKSILDDVLRDKTDPIGWNFLEESPHITLGCYKHISKSIKEIVEKYYEYPSCKINRLGVSISGNKGVCLSELKSFDLFEKQ